MHKRPHDLSNTVNPGTQREPRCAPDTSAAEVATMLGELNAMAQDLAELICKTLDPIMVEASREDMPDECHGPMRDFPPLMDNYRDSIISARAALCRARDYIHRVDL